jgi:hypothetical protein
MTSLIAQPRPIHYSNVRLKLGEEDVYVEDDKGNKVFSHRNPYVPFFFVRLHFCMVRERAAGIDDDGCESGYSLPASLAVHSRTTVTVAKFYGNGNR